MKCIPRKEISDVRYNCSGMRKLATILWREDLRQIEFGSAANLLQRGIPGACAPYDSFFGGQTEISTYVILFPTRRGRRPVDIGKNLGRG